MPVHLLKQKYQPTIATQKYGDPFKPMILFIHGFSQSRWIWEKQVNSLLACKYHLVTVDLCGHGESDKPKNRYNSAKQWANDIKNVIDYYRADGFILCAWSYGAMIACDFIRYYNNNKFKGVNFIAPFINNGSQEDEKFIPNTLYSFC